jgi:FkbM family methyltransferase
MNLEPIKTFFTPNTILDIGAHFGEFAAEAKSYFPDSHIVCIEANKDCEPFLQNSGFEYYITLLGDKNNKVVFFKNREDVTSTGNSIYRELTHHYRDENIIKEQLVMDTLDNLFQSKNKNYDLIKIDTQGSEIDILRGGQSIVSNAKGILLEVSYTPYNKNAPLEQEVINYMNTINFTLKEVLAESPWVGQRDLFFVKNDQ